jgi:isoaspartyl peptidase/L-asparaginase-like protein (Ntn-hydrolase superfamily)
MKNRRHFLKGTLLGATGALLLPKVFTASTSKKTNPHSQSGFPMVISTWNHGLPANDAAMAILQNGGKAIDAVEKGVMVPEADPESMSVGYGGLPDRDGYVTLDACIMDHNGNCGAVSFLEHIKHPISVARKVMDDTPHVMLSGKGAFDFAIEQGFPKEDLLTDKSREKWEEWKKDSQYKPIVNVENHDTIGLLALDKNGDISGACTTSGLSFKMHGRVGDSPIIGAGMFVDNEVGGCCATGMGEAVMKTLGSFLVVELMRQGASPQEACEEAIARIVKNQNYKDMQIGYLAINKKGEHGAYAVHPQFNYALHQGGKNELIDSPSHLK